MLAAETGLTPAEFWGSPDDISTGMTIREFDFHVKGYQKRFDLQMEQLAWVCSNVMSCWSKKPVKMSHLLPKKKKEEKQSLNKYSDASDVRSELNKIRDEKEEKVIIPLEYADDVDPLSDAPFDLETFNDRE